MNEVRIVKYKFKEFGRPDRDEVGLFTVFFSKDGKPLNATQLVPKEENISNMLSLCESINKASKLPVIESSYTYENDGMHYMDIGVSISFK